MRASAEWQAGIQQVSWLTDSNQVVGGNSAASRSAGPRRGANVARKSREPDDQCTKRMNSPPPPPSPVTSRAHVYRQPCNFEQFQPLNSSISAGEIHKTSPPRAQPNLRRLAIIRLAWPSALCLHRPAGGRGSDGCMAAMQFMAPGVATNMMNTRQEWLGMIVGLLLRVRRH